MKKLSLLTLGLMLLPALSLTSCGEDDWYPSPPYGWDSFYDNRLDGYWQLVQANDAPVGQFDTNWLYFNGNGRGMYYYYSKGERYSERIGYYCQDSSYGSSRYQINIQYEYGNPATMNYWFTGSTLWMQWFTSNRTITYLYRPVNSVNW